MSVSHLFSCCICRETHNEDEARWDDQLNGPVCKDCANQAKMGLAWLRHSLGVPIRPMEQSDINQYNHKRFKL